MRSFISFISLVVLVVFLIAAGGAAVITYPTTVSAGWTPITLPPIPIIPIFDLHFWTELTTSSGSGYIQYPTGLDVNEDNLLTVGNNTSPHQIHFFDGLNWTRRDVDFSPFILEWSKNSYTTALYASDYGLDSIYMSTNPLARNPEWIKIGGPKSIDGGFDKPLGMFYGSRNTLYVVDSGNNRIKRWNGSSWDTIYYFLESSFLYDIAIYGSIIYITDSANNCIHYMNAGGDVAWHKLEDSSFINNPTYIDVDSKGNLYFVSYCKYGSEYKRSIVKYEDGNFSVYVPSGDIIGKISDVSTNGLIEAITINHHDNLFYSDHNAPWVLKEQCSVNNISSCSINGDYPQLTPGQIVIDWSVGSEIDEVVLHATPECVYASISGNGQFPLDFGLNTFTITCTPEIGSPKDYTLNITRELSDNALLSEITIASIPLEGFNPGIFTYSGISLPNETGSVEFGATPQDENAAVAGIGTISLSVGDNPIIISVLAQDGITAEQYLVIITREASEPSPTPTPTASPSSEPTDSPAPSVAPPESPESSESPNPTPGESEIPSSTDSPDPSPVPSLNPDDEVANNTNGNLNWLFIAGAAIIAAGAVGYSIFITRKMKKEKNSNKK